MEFLTRVERRGLHGIDPVVSDHHGGLTRAVRPQFQGRADAAMWHASCSFRGVRATASHRKQPQANEQVARDPWILKWMLKERNNHT